jgi:anti-sigma factor (TIGR02949 family)
VSEVAIEGLAAREGDVVSREERSHEGDEQSGDPAGSGNQVVECATVIAQVWRFLDGECTDDTRAWVCEHLQGCEGCLRYYALEGRIKNLIATKCGGDTAPERLKWPR